MIDLEAALCLAAEGLSLIPLKPRDKRPALPSWEEFQRRISTPEEIRHWFGNGDEHNMAIVCGAVSGNLAVIDFDVPEAYHEWVSKYGAILGDPPVVQTAHGFHVYIRTSSPIRTRKIPHGDIKAEGGYVVGPGSIHPEGAIYTLVSGDLAKIPTLDPELVGFEVQPPEPSTPPSTIPEVKRMAEGNRNDTLYRDACALRRRGLERSAILAALLQENADQCVPPLSRGEVEGIVDSAMRQIPHVRAPLKVIGIDDILNAPPVTWLVEGLFYDATLSMLASYAGRGKSLVSLALAAAIASGRPFLGRYPVVRQGPVLFIDEENSHSDLRDRIMMMGIPTDLPLHFISFESVDLGDPSCVDRVLDVMREVNPVLTVMDSFVRLHRCQENDASEMSRIMRVLRGITNEGFGLLVLHHHSKGQGDLGTRSRGSSDIVGGIDVEYALDTRGDDLVLCTVKSRRAPIEPVRLQIVSGDGKLDVRYLGPGSYRRDEIKSAILEVVQADGEIDRKSLLERVHNRGINVSDKTFREIVESLVGNGLTERIGPRNRKIYGVPDDGGL